MRDPLQRPYCRPEDLGRQIPDSPHAVSVCLPTWDSVIGYEEGRDDVVERLQLGYPRFVLHPAVAELADRAQDELARSGEAAMLFPSIGAAWRAADAVKASTGIDSRLESYADGELTALIFPETVYGDVWKVWQHGGEIVSSRWAESLLDEADPDQEAGELARRVIRERLASFHDGIGPEDVFLFSSGMAAIFAVHRAVCETRPDLPTLQVEFPYLDTFKLQEKWGEVVDGTITRTGGIAELEALGGASGRGCAGVFLEVPSNPLLRTGDVEGLSALAKPHGIPLIIDDTVATSINVDGFRYADVVTTSLTKVFSGVGDVMAGCAILNPRSEIAGELGSILASAQEAAPLWFDDAVVLEANSRNYPDRARAANDSAASFLDWLESRSEISKLFHPKLHTSEGFECLRRSSGGHGGLLSFELDERQVETTRFFDRLRVSKGPSLGTPFSLACPYTLLAHYGELLWAENRGARRNLLRFWVGSEETSDLCSRFLDAAGKKI